MTSVLDDAIEAPASYWSRRADIAELATGIDAEPGSVEYSDAEDRTWATVVDELHPIWDRWAAPEVLAARDRLELPIDRVPQLCEVNRSLGALTGVRFRAVPGILPGDRFFDALARSRFPSTQYIRWSGAPSYTPEPDIVHEVLGHGTLLACEELATMHRLAGEAYGRLHRLALADADPIRTQLRLQQVSDVFWYTVEFGVVRAHREPMRWHAYGAGLLSSPGELGWFGAHADVRSLDVAAMCSTPYDIHHYQPVLFGADSLDHLLEVVGGFFDDVGR